ncbi:YopX family protein [Streptococcus suis]
MIPKFRGVSISDNNKGQWMYGNLIIDGNYAYIVNGVIECNDQYITIAEWCPVEPKTIGASTGLFDKNGQEIFEGDVVNIFDEKLSKIYFSEGAFCVDVLNGGTPLHVYLSEHLELIGNIYENPELVEANND